MRHRRFMMHDAPQERAKLEFSAEEFNQNGRDVVKVTCVCHWYLLRYKYKQVYHR